MTLKQNASSAGIKDITAIDSVRIVRFFASWTRPDEVLVCCAVAVTSYPLGRHTHMLEKVWQARQDDWGSAPSNCGPMPSVDADALNATIKSMLMHECTTVGSTAAAVEIYPSTLEWHINAGKPLTSQTIV